MFSSYILNTAIEQGGDRETDGDEDRMTGTYAADKESDAEKGNFCNNCRVNCCVRVCVWSWSQGHPTGLHFPPRCQTHNADSFPYELRAAEMEIGPTACLSVFLRVRLFSFLLFCICLCIQMCRLERV